MPKIEIELPEAPEGYECTGEFRQMWQGERGLNIEKVMIEWPGPGRSEATYFILRKKRWVPEASEEYYYIDENLMIAREQRGGEMDDLNMWKTEEAAKNVLKAVKELYESLDPETGLSNKENTNA
jgi:hypothetical protein